MDGRPILSVAIALTAVAALGAGLTAQDPRVPLPPGTGAISGRVVDAQSGEPLANVVVMMAALRVLGSHQTTTNAAGFYQFANLAEHEYHVNVLDPLYLRTCYGATDATQVFCAPVVVGRDQHRRGVDFRLVPGAVIRGRVVDEEGRAVGGATVRASLAPTNPAAVLPSVADTKRDGTFELLGLAAGDTLLSLDMPVTAARPRAPTVFYPGVVSADAAEPIPVTAGLVTTGITFRYPNVASRSVTARISAPATGATVIKAWLYRVEPRMVRALPLDADGAGSVTGLLEGRYFIAAQAEGDSQPFVASEVAELFGDTAEVSLLLQEPGKLTGKIVAEKGGLPPLTDVRVAAKWTDGDGEEINPMALDDVEAGPDGSFRIDGLFGLRSVQLLGLSPEWQVRSIRQGRSEIASSGVTVAPGATIDVVVTVGRR